MGKVSTIIPVYNGERTIAQAIDSALAQDWDDHEIIVVNDGSTDFTSKILQDYKNRIRVISLPNGGQAKARNVGVAKSTGRYLAFLDADDAWVPNKLRMMVPALEGRPSASLAFSECRLVNKDGLERGESLIGHPPSMDEIPTSEPFPVLPSTWVLTREIFDHVGGFSERFKGAQGFEDTWMLLLLRELGEFLYLPESLTIYRVHDFIFADKYGPGLPIFFSLVNERYGAKGRRWIRAVKSDICRTLLSKVALQMNAGDKLGALITLGRIFRLQSSFFFRAEFIRRMLAPQNTRRFWQIISTLPKTRIS